MRFLSWSTYDPRRRRDDAAKPSEKAKFKSAGAAGDTPAGRPTAPRARALTLRDVVRRGPRDGEEARQIVAAAMEHLPTADPALEKRLAGALMDMLVSRHLGKAALEARASALAILDEIDDLNAAEYGHA